MLTVALVRIFEAHGVKQYQSQVQIRPVFPPLVYLFASLAHTLHIHIAWCQNVLFERLST